MAHTTNWVAKEKLSPFLKLLKYTMFLLKLFGFFPVEKEKLSPFLKLLKYALFLLKLFGFFPVTGQQKLNIKNIWSFAILSVLFGLNLYTMVAKAIPAGVEIFLNFTVEGSALFSLWFWFCINFNCLLINTRLGYQQKLTKFDLLMQNATRQSGIKQSEKSLKIKFVFSAIRWICVTILIAILHPLLIFTKFTTLMPSLNAYKNMFGDTWYMHLFASLLLMWNSVGISLYGFIYWACCECLKQEFLQVNDNLEKCDLRDLIEFKSLTVCHARLLKCFRYLSDIYSFTIFVSFAGLICTGVLQFYIMMLDVFYGFRILAAFFVIGGFGTVVAFCFSADSLQRAVSFHTFLNFCA
jgi:hypothetical protein